MDWLTSLYPRFAFPEALVLLALVPLAVWLGARLRSLAAGRKWAAIVLRATIITLLVLALAGAELVRRRDKLAVFFLLDHSNSIPEETRLAEAKWVEDAARQYMTRKDEAGVIVFGDQPSIELSVDPGEVKLEHIKSFVGGEQTDIAAAVRLAMAAFPQGYMRRIVIYSDGNETRGSALEEAKLAQASGAEVNVVPLSVGGRKEVRVSEVTAPTRAKGDEPFQLRVVVHSDQDCEAIMKVYQRLKEGKSLIVAQNVTLRKGDNVFLLSQELHSAGFYEYEVTIESESDTVAANNEGRAFTVVYGEPTVLYVESDPKHSIFLKPALEEEGLKVEQVTPGEMPTSLAQLQNYDAIVLSNVSAPELGAELMQNIESAVRDLGIGLVMIGGPETFGAGGYLDTPVEAALPVDMDIKQRKILPRGALVLVMHTCEIPEGNVWAREIGLASLNVLASKDLMGAIGFMWSSGSGFSGDTWIYPLQEVGDKSMMRAMLTKAASQIGDMPDVGPSMKLGLKALAEAPAAVKRMVLISDGDPAAPPKKLIDDLVAAQISVSTVCIAPHSPNDQNMLRAIAVATGGNYYYVTNPRNLPQIFSKEASVVKRGMFVEEPFTPVPHHDSELLLAAAEGLPQLNGYVVTSAKAKATVPLVSHEDDPVLAHWRYGLGKSAAFTSDVTTRWAPEWVGWSGFARFWSQTVRWAMREMSPSNFRAEVASEKGMGRIRIDAVDDDGKFVNFLKPKAVVTGPGPDFARYDLELDQTGPGIYEADFPLEDRGAYMINITYAAPDGTEGMIPTGIALSYSREYEYNTTNLPLLENVAAAGGGRVMAETDNPFEHTLKASAVITPVWKVLVIIAICLFPVEIFIRRMAINYAVLYEPVLVLLRRVPLIGKRIPAPRDRTAPVTGFYGTIRPQAASAGTAAAPATPVSFGVASEPADEAAVKAAAKKHEQAQKRDQQAAEYTGKLLAAKKRAQDQIKRRSSTDDDKEEK